MISEVDAVTSGVQNCQVAGLVPAFRQPGDHCGTLGAHWGTMGAADRTASWSMIFRDWRRLQTAGWEFLSKVWFSKTRFLCLVFTFPSLRVPS